MNNYQIAKSTTRIIFGISLFIHNFIILMLHQLKIDQKLVETLSDTQKIILGTYGIYNLIGKSFFFLGLFILIHAVIKEKGIKRKYSTYLGIYCFIYLIFHFVVLKIVSL